MVETWIGLASNIGVSPPKQAHADQDADQGKRANP
jgi:hypothetical protein